MPDRYEKTWKRSAFKERNDKICRLWTEGMKVSILSERFGVSDGSVRNVLKGAGLYGQKIKVRLRPFGMDKGRPKGKHYCKGCREEGKT